MYQLQWVICAAANSHHYRLMAFSPMCHEQRNMLVHITLFLSMMNNCYSLMRQSATGGGSITSVPNDRVTLLSK